MMHLLITHNSALRVIRLPEVEKVNEEYELKLRGVGEMMPDGSAYGGRAQQIVVVRYNDNKYAAIDIVGLFEDYTGGFKDITKEQFEQAKKTATQSASEPQT